MIKIAFKHNYVLQLPKSHTFPMEKYDLLPRQLKYLGIASEDQFFEPIPIPEEDILLTHTEQYWSKLKNLELTDKEAKKTGFPQSMEMVKREVDIASGTYQLARHALKYGCGLNIAGGTHHAFSDHGEGYCLLNDQAVAANILLRDQQVHKVLIVDLDVHQGNGTAEIFHENDRVFTFSMHGARNYPTQKMVSDLDIALPCKTEDEAYLKILKETLPQLIKPNKPDIVFYQAGVDVMENDKFGKLSLSLEGCMKRDETVLSLCQSHKIPVVVTMGGGYNRKFSKILDAHANTFVVATHYFM
ncbi:MAG: histone deacetylase [Lentisphaerales bacterium]|nr:histone deacetylase [Lentisphaerales bacterium]